jgi:integrase
MAGKGHIAKKGDKYYLVLSRGSKRPPKWIKMKATTDEAAELERDEIAVDRRRNVWMEPNKTTFDDFTDVFLKDMNKAVERKRKAKATYEWYEQRLRNHILPVIGWQRIQEIKKRDLQDLYDDIYEESPNMAEAVYRILHAMWAAMIREEDLNIENNLAEKIERAEKEDYEAPTWTGKQVTYFLKNAKETFNIRFYGIFLLGFAAGMRLGEILGLTLEDVDHKNMVIHVRRSITLNKPYDYNNLFKKTKTYSSKRDIRMIPAVSDTLKELRKQQIMEELACKDYHKLGLVFTMSDGRPINYSNLRENYWFRLIDQLNSEKNPLPPMKLHSMRHSCATWLLNELHVPLDIIQSILGHSTKEMTKLYAHAGAGAQDPAMELVNEQFRQAGL